MAQIVVIDLGTSNTVVAHVPGQGAGPPRVLADADGAALIPSVVSFHPNGKVLVGNAAKARRFIDSPNTIFAAKRLMGRTWTDPALQDARKRLPYQLRRGANEAVRVMLRGELYTMPEVSAFVLRKAKAIAEAALGETVDRAVVTVPANFNELQRNATKLAGTLANLDVVRVLNEPTAAALAYGYGTGASERIVVYDFGGGTFDLSLLSMFEDVFRVRATAGDMFLGGDDIDFALANAMADDFLKKHYYDARTHPEIFDQLRDGAERLKVLLSVQNEASLTIPALIQGTFGRDIDFTFHMTRKEFDVVVAPFVERTIKVCADTFAKAKVPPSAFDQVVLVGGSTRIPLVRERVAEFFGRVPETNIDPDQAVALGAALQAMAMKDVPATVRARAAASEPIEITDFELVAPSLPPPRMRGAPPVPPPRAAPRAPEAPATSALAAPAPARAPRRWPWIASAAAAMLVLLSATVWFAMTHH